MSLLINTGKKAEQLSKQDKYLEAAQLFMKSAEAERNSPEPRLNNLANELGYVGVMFARAGQYDRQSSILKRQWRSARSRGRRLMLPHTSTNIGSVYGSRGQYDKAGKYHEEALAIRRKLGKEADVAAYLYDVGSVYKSWAQYEKAIKYFQEAVEINKKAGEGGYCCQLSSTILVPCMTLASTRQGNQIL